MTGFSRHEKSPDVSGLLRSRKGSGFFAVRESLGCLCFALSVFCGFGFHLGSCIGGYCCLRCSFSFLGGYVMNVVDGLAVKINGTQASGLTGALTHVAKIIAADFTTLGNFYLYDQRAVEQEALLNADTAGDAADGDAAGMATLEIGADNQALEDLDTFFVTFSDLLMNAHGVTTPDVYDGRFLILLVNFLDHTLHIR
jgi:hypothetical protein